ncbi:hypothetical protein BCR32DRAFT_265046 [Anaeromyces robustus]|uniref:S phase cyclin A-associated protein in the endoplasmic reticulum N-terminal domain-containing protein n=1 Tax=Anaeromyces robustus TaxID=1754192 RepID=A0A1Y1XLI1_9FUNG|nr:hypothetical protein BCR32DRAFT_265046 [Anaeromyces robustus]|eukprot:ORX86356.1 hypothetical protein BCR32DRAFT_265046 [Anaeromyces robustus]
MLFENQLNKNSKTNKINLNTSFTISNTPPHTINNNSNNNYNSINFDNGPWNKNKNNLKSNLYRKDSQNLFENDNPIKTHSNKNTCQNYIPTSILSNLNNNSYFPYKDANIYFDNNKVTGNPLSFQNYLQTPKNNFNFLYSNQIKNINTNTLCDASSLKSNIACIQKINKNNEIKDILLSKKNESIIIKNEIKSEKESDSDKEKDENIKILKEKLENADKLRMDMLNKRIEKSKVKTQKINELKLKRQTSDKDLMKQIQKKQEEAAKKRRVHINTIKHKAKDENQKSNEIVFIQAMSLEHKKTEVIRRQEESIARKEKIDQTKLEKITKMNELQKINNERRKLLNETRAQKVKTQHEKKWKINKRREVEKKLNNLLNKRLISEQQTKRINEFKNNLIIEEEELRKEINNKVEMASKRHAEQIELVKEKAAAVIKHSKTIAEHEGLYHNDEDDELNDSPNIDLPIVTINKDVRKRNKIHKKEFIKMIQEKNKKEKNKSIKIENINDKKLNETIIEKINEISEHFNNYNIKEENPKEKLKQLNNDINYLSNISEKFRNEIIQSNILLTILNSCLKTEDIKWIFPLKCLSFINHNYMDDILFKSIINSETSTLFNMINVQSRILLLLESTKESDDQLIPMIDLINISSIIFKIIAMILDYIEYDNDLHILTVKYLLNTSVFKPINIKFNIKELYSKGSPLNDFYYYASVFYFKASFINYSWKKPIYEKFCIKDDISYFSYSNNEIINDFIIMMDSLLLYKGCSHSVTSKLSNKMLEISLNVLKTLNNITALNSNSIKTLLNIEIMQNQLFHFVSFWLDYWFMWVYPALTEENEFNLTTIKNENEDKNSINFKTGSLLTQILHELILTIGYFCLYSKETKNILRLGQRPVILQKLINLPLQYFIHPHYYEILFPTLIISCYNEPNNLRVLQDNFSNDYLTQYLENELNNISNITNINNNKNNNNNNFNNLTIEISSTTTSTLDSSILNNNNNQTKSNYHERFKLINRFPKEEWENAIIYFSNKE